MIKFGDILTEELSSLPEKAKIMIIGQTDTGKSTFIKILARWFNHRSQKVAIVDCDIGQSDIGPPGFVSYGILKSDIISLQEVDVGRCYMVGDTSPRGRELQVIAGTEICVGTALKEQIDIIIIDTCGLIKPNRGLEFKCAKAAIIKPDLIISFSTPEIQPLSNCLRALGYKVRNVLPFQGVRNKSQDERRQNRISCWNKYIKNNIRQININFFSTEVRKWWSEYRYTDINQVPHGTVAAICYPQSSGFHVPCIWIAEKDTFSVLAPIPGDFQPDTVWVSQYKLELKGTTVVSA